MKKLLEILFGVVTTTEAKHEEILNNQLPIEYYRWRHELNLPHSKS